MTFGAGSLALSNYQISTARLLRVYFLLLLNLMVFAGAQAQTGTISGKIVRADTKTPLAKVSVFLSNATVGATTDEAGNFTLRNIRPGQYDLVATSVGFEDFTQQVLVNATPIAINVEMRARVMQLEDVVVTNNDNWKANYQMFLAEFFGTSAYARQCKISNPHDLVLIYSKSKRTLTALSYDFINIENKALGYRIRFLLKNFKSDKLNNIISWQGKVLYEELPGSAAQRKIWEQRRQDIYYGSAMQFFRSLVDGNYERDGFVMRILARRPNAERPPDPVIQRKIDKFDGVNSDSLRYWVNKYQLPKYHEHLYRDPLKIEQVVKETDRQGIYGMAFPECLYVVYTKKRETQDFKDIYRPLDWENFETSVVTLYTPYILFDKNGSILSNPSPLQEGTWSKNKIAELLPVDFEPSATYTPPYIGQQYKP